MAAAYAALTNNARHHGFTLSKYPNPVRAAGATLAAPSPNPIHTAEWPMPTRIQLRVQRQFWRPIR